MVEDEQLHQAKSHAALLMIDVINDLNFPGAERLRPEVEQAIEPIQELRSAAYDAGMPVIYVNDNYGHWRSDHDALVERMIGLGGLGATVARRLRPSDEDYFVIKPQFSGFYATNLQALLPRLGITRLILAGWAADICVLFTAADAHMREYDLWIPSDIVASESEDRKGWALEIMRKSMGAQTQSTRELALEQWLVSKPTATSGSGTRA